MDWRIYTMQLKMIDLQGIRQLVNRSFKFEPGINLVHGPNEAGKSTLMESIAILLYGYFEPGRISKEERDRLNNLKPWMYSASFGGVLQYQLDNGDVFEVRRTFAPDITTVISVLPNQRIITDRFRYDSDGRVYFADEQFGISKVVFDNVCVVKQAELALLEDSATNISNSLMTLSSTMSKDGISVNDAIEKLEQTHKLKVGSNRAYTKPFILTRNKLESLENEIQETTIKRDNFWQKVSQLNQKNSTALLREECTRYEFLLLQAKKTDIDKKIEKVESLKNRKVNIENRIGEFSSYENFPYETYEEILRLETKRKSLDEELQSEPTNLKDQLQVLDEENRQILKNKEKYADLTSELVSEIQEKQSDIIDLQNNLKSLETQIDDHDDRINKLHNEIEEIEDSISYYTIKHNDIAVLEQQIESKRTDLQGAEKSLKSALKEWERTKLSEDEFLALKDQPAEEKNKRGCRNLFGLIGNGDKQTPPADIYKEILPIYESWQTAKNEHEQISKSIAIIEQETRVKFDLEEEQEITSEVFQLASEHIDSYMKKQTSKDLVEEHRKTQEEQMEEVRKDIETLKKQLDELVPEGFDSIDEIISAHEHSEEHNRQLEDIEEKQKRISDEIEQWNDKQTAYEQLVQELTKLYEDAGIDSELSFSDKFEKFQSDRQQYIELQNVQQKLESAQNLIDEFPYEEDDLIARRQELEKEITSYDAHMYDLTPELSIEDVLAP